MYKYFLIFLASSIFSSASAGEALYSADFSKWRKEASDPSYGDAYICSVCKHQIMLSVFVKPDPGGQSVPDVMKQMKSDDDRLRMAEHLFRSKIPPELLGSSEYEITRVGFSEVSDVPVFQYTGALDMNHASSMETFMAGSTKETAFSITINYFYGDLDKTSEEAIGSVLRTIRFK